MILSKLKQSAQALFGKYLLATNVVTCGSLLGVGDFVVQRSQISYMKHKKGEIIEYDKARTVRMIGMGFILGPFNHYWYSFLDKLLVGKTMTVVLKKIAADQAVAGPFFCSSFLIGMSLFEGKTLGGAVTEWKDKFISIYIVDWMFWPAAQLINFRFIPGQFRVLYVSSATLLWNSFLSYIKHQDGNESNSVLDEHIH